MIFKSLNKYFVNTKLIGEVIEGLKSLKANINYKDLKNSVDSLENICLF